MSLSIYSLYTVASGLSQDFLPPHQENKINAIVFLIVALALAPHSIFNFLFFRTERMVSSNHKYIMHEYDVNEFSIRSRLTIRNFQPSDAGQYRCICKNSMSSSQVEERIEVYSKSGKDVVFWQY